MDIKAVLISLNVEGTANRFESSGILIDSSIILITGTALLPLVECDRGWVSSFVKSVFPNLAANELTSKVSFRVFQEEICGTDRRKSLPLESKMVGVWKCPLVSQSVDKLLYDWTLGHVTHNNESRVLSDDEIDISKELMSIFMLLICHRGRIGGPRDALKVVARLFSNLREPERGEEVELISTPFGNEHFINSLSRGVIGNILGQEKCIILFDCRAVSGCEGGPIFAVENSRNSKKVKGKLLGVVSCPLSWWRGEWVGFTIGISLVPVLKRLLQTQKDYANILEISNTKSANSYPDSLSVEQVDDIVVLIRSGTSWGSGVVLDAASGLIITCSHVVKDEKIVSVFYKGKELPSRVVFKSKVDVAYDLAIVETMEKFVFKSTAEFSYKSVEIGEMVTAAGFPFFSETDDLHIRPTLSSGCVSGANPYMIQTTCCIQSGFSGGAVFRDGQLLGIIVSNTRNSSAALFPHINFVIPSSVFREPVFEYIKTRNVECLKVFESSNYRVQFLWSLQTSKL